MGWPGRIDRACGHNAGVTVNLPAERDRSYASRLTHYASRSRHSLLLGLPLLLYFAWIFRNHLRNPFYSSLVGGLNLGIHELGHFLWSPLGEFWSILGGSLTQCLAPIVVMILFYRQRDYFAIAIGFCWLGTNLFSVATYAADGLTQQLELVSPVGDDPIHDWGYLLGRWKKLSKAREIGGAIRSAAVVSMVLGLIGGTWLLWWGHLPMTSSQPRRDW